MRQNYFVQVWHGICEQDSLNPQLGVAVTSRIACDTPNFSKKKVFENETKQISF
jgi:hypothetical protein